MRCSIGILSTYTGSCCGVLPDRSWGIGGGQTEAQQKSFEAQLITLDESLSTFGGPFLLGERVSLVRGPFGRVAGRLMPHPQVLFVWLHTLPT